MQEIKLDEFVRTIEGHIGKIIFIDKVNFDEIGYFINNKHLANEQKGFPISESRIKKHSNQIMRLLEDDDLVEIEYYVSKYRKRIKRVFTTTVFEGDTIWLQCPAIDFNFDIIRNKWKKDAKGHNPKIVRILTKERFQQESYEA